MTSNGGPECDLPVCSCLCSSALCWCVAGFLQKLVELDNCKFEEWCVEMSEMRKQSVDKGKAKHEEVKELYQRLPAGAGL